MEGMLLLIQSSVPAIFSKQKTPGNISEHVNELPTCSDPAPEVFFYGKRIFLTIIVITQVLLVLIFVHSLYIVILFFALIHIP